MQLTVVTWQLEPDTLKLLLGITVVIIISKNSEGLAHTTCSKTLFLLTTALLIFYTIPKHRIF